MKKIFVIEMSLLICLFLLGACSHTIKKNDVIREMIIIVGISPNYPKEAAVNKIEGSVKLEFLVTKKGIVKDPIVISASPQGVFEKEAIRAILKYKFLPRSVNNELVEARATLTIDFKLKKDE